MARGVTRGTRAAARNAARVAVRARATFVAFVALLALLPLRSARAQPAEPLPPPPPPPPADSSNLPPPVAPTPRGGRAAPPSRGPRAAPPPREPVREPPREPAPPAPPPLEPVEAPDLTDHSMGGHTFLIPTLQDSAFVLTHVGLRQGLAWKSVSSLPAGPMGNVNVSSQGLTQTAQAGVRFTEWLGLELAGGGYVLTGTNVRSLIGFGAEYTYDGAMGLAVRIARFDKTRTYLGARVGVRLGGGRIVDDRRLVEALVSAGPGNAGDVPGSAAAAAVLTPTSTAGFRGSINVAQTITRAVGLQAQLGLAYDSTTVSPYDANAGTNADQHASSTIPSVALALGIDGSAYKMPVSLMLEYQILFPRRKDDAAGTTTSRTQHALALGAYYSGRRDVQVGVVGTAQLSLDPLEGEAGGVAAPSSPPNAFAIELVARYVW